MLLNNGTNFVSLNKVYSSTDIVLISWLQDPRMNSKFHCTNFVANSIESFLGFLCCFFDEILKMTKKLLTTRKIEIQNSILDPLKRVKINRLFRRKRGMASNPLFIIHTRLFFAFSQWDFPATARVWVWISCTHSCLDCLSRRVRMVFPICQQRLPYNNH